MSTRIADGLHAERTWPSRAGPRRRPRARGMEVVRPAQVYRLALCTSFARMAVIERVRDEGFSAPEAG